MSTNQDDTDTDETAAPFEVSDYTVEDLETHLDGATHSQAEYEALLNAEIHDKNRSSAIDALSAARDDAQTTEAEAEAEAGGEGDTGAGSTGVDTEAIADPETETAVASEDADTEGIGLSVGDTVTIRPAKGDPYVAGEWFDDGEGTRDVAYSRRVEAAVEAGTAEIVE